MRLVDLTPDVALHLLLAIVRDAQLLQDLTIGLVLLGQLTSQIDDLAIDERTVVRGDGRGVGGELGWKRNGGVSFFS